MGNPKVREGFLARIARCGFGSAKLKINPFLWLVEIPAREKDRRASGWVTKKKNGLG